MKLADEALKISNNDKDKQIRELEKQTAVKQEKKAETSNDAMQKQMEELKLLMLSLHTKADSIQEDVTEIKQTTHQLDSTLQNFMTSDAPVPRLILIGPPPAKPGMSDNALSI